MNNKLKWSDWNPGLDNDDLTLEQVLNTLPGAEPEEVSVLVRLFENPKSPIALTGATSLRRHDCIHIVLGRGLLGQDEAFVIGYTMGTSKDISVLETALFKNIAQYLYPKNYRMSKTALIAYDLGLEAGKKSRTEKIYEFPFEDHLDWTVKDLRNTLNIDKEFLRRTFKEEQKSIPDSKASKRLPV